MRAQSHDVAKIRTAIVFRRSHRSNRSTMAQGSTMTPNSLIRIAAALIVLLNAATPVHAASCEDSIGRVQAQLDSAIEKNADANGWSPESLEALRGRQPTPRSLAQAEGARGAHLRLALDALDRARAADGSGDIARCRRELSEATLLLQQEPQ